MKTRIISIIILLHCMFMAIGAHPTYRVTIDDALSIAQKCFEERDVDYFVLRDDRAMVMTEWTIFVDAEPMKGWSHECYLLRIPLTSQRPISQTSPKSIVQLGTAPTGNYEPLLVKNRYGANANAKPTVAKSTLSNDARDAAQRTYAVILSGGINKMLNYERYWNDCSFIYQTLVNKYGVPKENIFPIMSDGDDPAKDMRLISGNFASQPLDLDNDGADDIELAATCNNIRLTLSSLTSIMSKEDHLFFYVIDHGSTSGSQNESSICLWNNESLSDTLLAEWLRPLTNKGVNVNVVLGQCFAGGFIDNLTRSGCVVAAACTGSENSFACSDIPFDEFVYHWTCAVNGATHKNVKVNSDTDANGRVTMQEAFEYAKKQDRISDEHPQYESTPISIGEDLAFNNLAPSVDIYVKDNPEDTGKEPNTTTDAFWISPSICVRNQDDGIFKHENPIYSSDHQMAFVYVRVYNRGKEEFDGTGKWVQLYWAQASTTFSDKAWKGREIYNGKYATGGVLEAVPIPKIEPGGFADVVVGWTLPQLLKNYPEGNFHFCLLVKLRDTPYDDGYVEGKTYFDLRDSNDQAQKNVTIISKNDLTKGFNVYVRNACSSSKAYTLELVPRTAYDAKLFSRAKVEMEMSPKIYSAWERGGFQCQDVVLAYPGTTNEAASRKVKFVSPESKLQNVSLYENEFDIVKIKFDFNNAIGQALTYTLDLIQKDEDGNIIGGETFAVESPGFTPEPIEIGSAPASNGQVRLSVDKTGFNTVVWTDSNGKDIGSEESVIVVPKFNDCEYSVTGITENGDLATGSISLEDSYGIKSINTSNNVVEVNLRSKAPAESWITVSSVLDGASRGSYRFPEGSDTLTIDTSGLTKGIYVVSYMIDSEIIDQRKLTLE